ncbi:MAG: helix-turn-helix domain-containing protein, partial [Pseudomonadota bacterium]|nr:helix-turn-helix domain-containing protein [Pseudomonadota bacterium]
IGFQMNSDVIGMDGMASNLHSTDVVALETSEVCLIDPASIDSVPTLKKLHRHFDQVFSREIIRLQNMALLLGGMNAHQKMAAFLINLSKRFERLNYSRNEFYLRMTRVELASYLGLTNATISRTLTVFKTMGLIKTNGRKIVISDYEKLLSIILDTHLG